MGTSGRSMAMNGPCKSHPRPAPPGADRGARSFRVDRRESAMLIGTMRRSRWRRALSAACGVWLAIALAEPAALHTCAMHDAHGHSATPAPSSPVAHEHAGASHESHRHDGAPLCTCVGACCAAVAVAPPEAEPLLAFPAPVRHAVPRVPVERTRRPAAFEHARPPTIGPPHRAA
jgi:hypothetical protein